MFGWQESGRNGTLTLKIHFLCKKKYKINTKMRKAMQVNTGRM